MDEMVLEWTLTVGVGLMVGISFGILVQLRYMVMMDARIQRLLQKVEAMEERELQVLAKKTKKTASKKKTTKRKRK